MTTTIDFSDLSRGTSVDNEYSSQGVTITGVTAQGVGGRAMIFDTSRPTGGDYDLATNNLGNVLIISEDGDAHDPDDNWNGGLLRFDFDDAATVHALTFLDIEEGATVRFYDTDGDLIATETVRTADNGQSVAHFGVEGVTRMDVQLHGSGAIDNLVFDAVANAEPEPADDQFGADEDSAAALGNVLLNDQDPDGDPLTVVAVNGDADNLGTAVSGSNGGLVTLSPDGNLFFDPNGAFDDLGEGETRDTTVTYAVADEDGATAMATVKITVTGTNDGPIATDNAYVVTQQEAAGDVDGNALTDDTGNGVDRDPEADLITIVAVDGLADNVGKSVAGSEGGLFTINADGTVDFDANGDFDDLGLGNSTDTSVTYTIADTDGATDTATITFTVTGRNDGTVQGSDGADVITPVAPFVDDDGDAVDSLDGILPGDEGTNNDVIDAMGGNDSVDAGLGRDTVFGGAGDDTIAGGLGNDRLFGGGGSDTVFGGNGADVIDTSGDVGAPDVGYPFQNPDPSSGNPFPFPGYAADTDPNDDRDFVSGGAGKDVIRTGDDNDTVYGDAGNDTINAGFDDDIVFGGSGKDLIEGSEGNDVLDGGAGDDVIYGGLEDPFADLVSFPDDEIDANGFQDLVPENNGDTIYGRDGNDRLFGQDDDDTLYGGIGDDYLDGGVDDDLVAGDAGQDTALGGQGNDTVLGGADEDTLFGGEGDDLLDGGSEDDVIAGGVGNDSIAGGTGDDAIDGGAGADVIAGGTGRDALFGGTNSDLFIGGNGGDVVVGGEDADNSDVDVLDLRDSNVDRIEYVDGDAEAGTVFFADGTTLTFSEIENIVPCFTPGTLIATPRGERPVEDLKVGDRVITRDNGIQEIAWLGRKPMSGTELLQNPHLQPVLIKRGALGQGLPERDMMVSPNHRMLVAGDKTQLYFEESEVLAAAKHMVGATGIHSVGVMKTTYIHFMFERHEVVLANGAWTESFQPGDHSLKGIGNSQRSEIFDLFPELETVTGLQGYQAARKSLKKHEAKLLLD